MKIIMVRSNPIDPDVRLEKEALALLKNGYEVILLGWDRFGNSKKNEKNCMILTETPIYEMKSGNVTSKLKNGYTIERIKFRASRGKKILFFLPVWWIFEFLWLFINKWDIVHAADFDTYLPALLAAKIKQKKIIYDIFDYYADEVKLPTIIQHLLSNVDNFLMRFSDCVIIVDDSRLFQIRKAKTKEVLIIYNTPIDQRGHFQLKNENINKKFKIFFAGSLMKDRDIFTIINIAKELGDIEIEIAGWGNCVNKIKELAAINPFLKFLGILQYNQVIDKTMTSDLLFALYNPNIPNNRYASPNKLFEAMMCGKPIIVNDGTSMANIVRKENCGIVVPYGDYHTIKEAIIKLKNNTELCKKLGENGRRAYDEKYNWEIMEQRLLKIYRTFEYGNPHKCYKNALK